MNAATYCDVCEDRASVWCSGLPGVIARLDGVVVHGHVERCDSCERFASDEDAQAALAAHVGAELQFAPDPQLLNCSKCDHSLRMPKSLSAQAHAMLVAAFGRLHEECLAGDGVCPVGDPGCDQPEDDEDDAPHCHDACDAPPETLVELLAYDAGVDFDIGDAWQSAVEVKDFVRLVAEVARKEALRA